MSRAVLSRVGEAEIMTTTKKPKNGKGHALQARITEDMRQSLDREAERTGRSLSQVAEVWLERGRLAWAQDQSEIDAMHSRLLYLDAALGEARALIGRITNGNNDDDI